MDPVQIKQVQCWSRIIAVLVALLLPGCTTLSVDFATGYGHVGFKTDGEHLSINYTK